MFPYLGRCHFTYVSKSFETHQMTPVAFSENTRYLKKTLRWSFLGLHSSCGSERNPANHHVMGWKPCKILYNVMNYPMKWRRISSINNIIHPNVIIVQPSAIPNLEEGFNCKEAQRVLHVDIARCLFLRKTVVYGAISKINLNIRICAYEYPCSYL